MSIFREIPPTAGFPFFSSDFLFFFSSTRRTGSLENDFKEYLGVNYAVITCSGTAAFYLILEALKDLSAKKTVVIPSYVCPLVPLAIKRAGLNIEICDINKDNFDFNINELENLCAHNNDILAIVPVHLAGIPVDLDALSKISKKSGIFIVEDCAQALGAVYKGKKAGTIGDFSFFSLARGKGLTIYEGGVIVTNNNEYAALVDKKIKSLAGNNIFAEAIKIIELFGYAIFYRPHLFWFIFSLPQLFWKLQNKPLKAMQEYYKINFPLHNVSNFRKMIGHFIFKRLQGQINQQQDKADYYIKALESAPGIKIVKASSGTQASYPYLTVIFDDPAVRDKLFYSRASSGLGISWVYICAISDYGYLMTMLPLKNLPNAQHMASNSLTLSTNIFLTPRDARKTKNFLTSALHYDKKIM